jgi:hypothetical protein
MGLEDCFRCNPDGRSCIGQVIVILRYEAVFAFAELPSP